jgi:signal peptidase I
MDQRRKSVLRETVEALLIALIFVNFARIFVLQAFKIPSGSMEETLLVGDHLLVNKFVYGNRGAGSIGRLLPFATVERGEIVVFRFPGEPDVDFVKRVIALPGERIEIANGRVWIDGYRLEEPYVIGRDDRRLPVRDDFGPVTLGTDEYFVMGDNRHESNDSRYWGPVKRDLISGRAWLIYWSFEGEPPPEGSSTLERMRELVRVALRFLPDTRWERTLRLVEHGSLAYESYD